MLVAYFHQLYFLLFPNEKQRRSKIFNSFFLLKLFNSFVCSLEKILRLQVTTNTFLKASQIERKKERRSQVSMQKSYDTRNNSQKKKKFYIKFSYSFQMLFSHTPTKSWIPYSKYSMWIDQDTL